MLLKPSTFFLLSALFVSHHAVAGWLPVEYAPDLSTRLAIGRPLESTARLEIALSLTNVQQREANDFVDSLYDPSSPNFHRWISLENYARRFGAPAHDSALVASYLRKNGFSNVHASHSGLFVFGIGQTPAVERAFHVTMSRYPRSQDSIVPGEDSTFYAPSTVPQLPAAIAPLVWCIHGLSDEVPMRPADQNDPAAAFPPSGPYTAAQLSVAYHNNRLPQEDPRVTVGVFSPTPYDPKAIANFRAQTGASGAIVEKHIDGGPTGSHIGEASLDIETILGQAHRATVILYESPFSMSGELDAYDQAGVDEVPVLTSSYFHTEADLCDAAGMKFSQDFEAECEALAAEGISLFDAAGDWGIYSNASNKVKSSKMEPCCPYVTAVGGTQLYLDSVGDWIYETGWIFSGAMKGWGGGGGYSLIFPIPSYQEGVRSGSTYKRQIPDVSAHAYTYRNYTADGPSVGYGTSGSSPLWAASTALMEQKLASANTPAPRFGLLNPALYRLGAHFEEPGPVFPEATYCFHDIAFGYNGRDQGHPGWDLCTGWGSADFYKLMTDLAYYDRIGTAYQPSYEPFTPAGWTSAIFVGTPSNHFSEPSPITTGDTLYISLAVKNVGSSDGPEFPVALLIDGQVQKVAMFNSLPAAGGYQIYEGIASVKLPAGSHTLTVVADYGQTVRETKPAAPAQSRTISVLFG